MSESPWSPFLFVREWQLCYCEYLAQLQASVMGALDVEIQKASIFDLLQKVKHTFARELAERPRYDGRTKIRVGTPQGVADLKGVDEDAFRFLSRDFNRVYQGAHFKGTVLGMIAGELAAKGYDLNRLKSLSLDDVDTAVRREGHRHGLDDLDAWLEETGVVKKQSVYSALYAETEGAKWLAVYNARNQRAGKIYETVTKMYRDTIAESVYKDEPFDKLRHRLVYAGDELARAQAVTKDGEIDREAYREFIETYLNRDFLRFARTETAFNYNNGRLLWLVHESGDRPRYVEFVAGGKGGSKSSPSPCQYCEEFPGTIARVFGSQAEFQQSPFHGGDDTLVGDPIAAVAVWPGKNNVNRDPWDWWYCTPVHPNCNCHYEPYTPPQERVSHPDVDAELDEIFAPTRQADENRRRAYGVMREMNKNSNRQQNEIGKAAGLLYAQRGFALHRTCAHEANEFDDGNWTRDLLRLPEDRFPGQTDRDER